MPISYNQFRLFLLAVSYLIVVRGVKRYTRYECDNRDATQMYDYMEARIDALKRRIIQLEDENRVLRLQIPTRNEKYHAAIRINSLGTGTR